MISFPKIRKIRTPTATLTQWHSNSERYAVTRVLNQVDDVAVMQIHYAYAVHRQYMITDAQ